MMKTLSMLLAPCFALSIAACGGQVSLGESGKGRDDLSGIPGADSGAPATDTGGVVTDSGSGAVDSGAVAVDTGSGSSDPGPWPMFGISMLDGGVDSVPDGALNQIVWSRWWDCGGKICQQQMWINERCEVWWNDRNVVSGTGKMAAADCANVKSYAVSLDLSGALESTKSCTPGDGAEEIEYHTGGWGGPWYRKRTEACTTSADAAFSMVRKSVVVGTRSIPGAKESDPHMPP